MTGRPAIAPIPEGLDPAARFVLRTIHERQTDAITMWRVEAGTDTIRAWHYRHGRGPSISTVRAALNELGYDLAVVPWRPCE
jgi:hypothetical protein